MDADMRRHEMGASHPTRIHCWELACSTLPLREHQRDGDATNTQQAPQSPAVVVFETIVKAVEPPLECLRLWPRHRNDESRFRDGAADLNAWRLIENGADIDRQRNACRPRAHFLDKPPAVRGQPDKNGRLLHHSSPGRRATDAYAERSSSTDGCSLMKHPMWSHEIPARK
jgi:hypothetical protein